MAKDNQVSRLTPSDDRPALAIQEYAVVASDSPPNLVRAVNAKTAEGWKATGGVAIHSFEYFQAIVREKA